MKEIKQTRISNCRICDANNFQEVILLLQMPLTDEFISKERIGKEFLADIHIAVCNSCGCTQNINDIDMREYYLDYTYSVHSSNIANLFMRTLSERVKTNYFSLRKNPKVIEIGSGTGEQLLEFKKLGFNVLGVEPSIKLAYYANSIGVKTLAVFFDENTKEFAELAFRKADIVVASYTFDHLPRPVEVLKNIHHILNDNGILVIEVHNLELIRQRNEYCLFEHEHYTYLNEQTMTYLLNQNNFEVLTFDLLSENEKRANSLLVVARKTDKIVTCAINVSDEIEKTKNFNSEIKKSIERIDQWLLKNKYFKIVAYGAGGRGIMTIAALNHQEIIKYIVDKNPKARNIFAPKSHLPVYSIDELENNRADKILIFSFGYYNEIVSELCEIVDYTPEQFTSILELLEQEHA